MPYRDLRSGIGTIVRPDPQAHQCDRATFPDTDLRHSNLPPPIVTASRTPVNGDCRCFPRRRSWWPCRLQCVRPGVSVRKRQEAESTRAPMRYGANGRLARPAAIALATRPIIRSALGVSHVACGSVAHPAKPSSPSSRLGIQPRGAAKPRATLPKRGRRGRWLPYSAC